MASNSEVARILHEIAEYLEMRKEAFKPRAYEKAAATIEALEEGVDELYARGGLKALEELPGVGRSIAEKIEELLKTGKLAYYESLKKKVPINLSAFEGIEGLGPKGILKLHEALGIRNIEDLERAAREGKISTVSGFGKKSEENILRSIAFKKKFGGRFVLGFVMPQIREIEKRLRSLHGVERVVVAGSVRRRRETIGDCDFLVISKTPKQVMDFFVAMPEVVRVTAHGETKSAMKLENGLDVDLRVVPRTSYGAALNYFTGSKSHNIALRELAIGKGWKLNEYGLWEGERQIAGETEEDLYAALGLRYIEPELRENTGEIECAEKGTLPHLVGYDDLKGDLQVQTNWTDGAHSIEEMARAAIAMGFEYIAITDHTKRLAMTGGLDEKRIQMQWKEIDAVNSKFEIRNSKFKILKGIECDILKDGSLDLPDTVLARLDVVGVSVHSYFNLSKEAQTARIVRAIRNPHVDILFHPTGRLLNRRPPYEVEMEEIIRVAKETGTVLEIDAFPDRLDLKDEYARKCVDAGVKLAIDSDAHAVEHFSYLEYGIAQARRGWATKSDVVNAWPLEKMLRFLKRG